MEKLFNLSLDAVLLVFPLCIMSIAYSKIAISLWQGIRLERQNSNLAATGWWYLINCKHELVSHDCVGGVCVYVTHFVM